MSDHWDVYFTNINDHFASVLLDMGIAEEAPDPKRPWLLYIWIKLNDPDETGMMKDDEFDAMNPIEEGLAEAVENALGAVHVGCITREERRELYFYAPSFEGLDLAVDPVMKEFASHEWMCDSKEDPDWEYYLELMYPTPLDLQVMGNRAVVEQLAEGGDSLEKERPVSHWAYFPDDAARSQFVISISAKGFEILEQSASDEPDDPTPCGLNFQRIDHVDWESINEVTIELFELADDLEGTYDGWETSVEKS